MSLTVIQIVVIISMVIIGTVITRFLPFVVFSTTKTTSPYITYLGNVLPYSAIGLLVVYCLKGVNLTNSPFGIPEAISIICIAILHYWRNNALLSIGGGTVIYMALLQSLFS